MDGLKDILRRTDAEWPCFCEMLKSRQTLGDMVEWCCRGGGGVLPRECGVLVFQERAPELDGSDGNSGVNVLKATELHLKIIRVMHFVMLLFFFFIIIQ